MSCPGCGGTKSRRAVLCARCRRRANDAGVGVVVERMSPGQLRAFHAIANEIDRLRRQPIGTTKARIRSELGVESLNDVSSTDASELIDRLDRERDDARAGL